MTPTAIQTLLRRPCAIWLLVLAAALVAIAPTISHALARSAGFVGHGADICTSDGPRWLLPAQEPQPIPGDSGHRPAGAPFAHALDDCALCLLYVAAWPPSAPHPFAAPGTRATAPGRAQRPVRSPSSLIAAARGPPVVS